MGYKTIPLRRGFTEIAVLYWLCQKHSAVICGGYARYCASPMPTAQVRPAEDVDLFPKSVGAAEELRRELLALGFELRHENHVSITMMVPKEGEARDRLLYMPVPQIIKPVVEGAIVTLGGVEEILDNFDFTIARAAILSPASVLVDERFEEDEKHGVLRLMNIHCPVSSMLRCCKYARKGYFMRPAETLKLFNDWSARDDSYRLRLLELFKESERGKVGPDNPDGMSQKEIDELESLLRID